nr:37s ribosomal protein s18, mitochondrial [Quercus suber]
MAATAKRGFATFICQSCRQRLLPQHHRSFGSTAVLRADDGASPPAETGAEPDAALTSLSQLRANVHERRTGAQAAVHVNHTSKLEPENDTAESLLGREYGGNLLAFQQERPHRMHVLAHKHNTHITLVQPPKPASQTANFSTIGSTSSDQKKIVDVLLSISAGNIGFRKSGRGSYDAAYQLAAFFLKQVQEKGLLRDINSLEVVLRGFGAGREAVTKVLLGTEGRRIRGKITAVIDATRLKLGGPRGKKPRRLG